MGGSGIRDTVSLWKERIEFLALGFSLVLPVVPQASGLKQQMEIFYLCVYTSLVLSLSPSLSLPSLFLPLK